MSVGDTSGLDLAGAGLPTGPPMLPAVVGFQGGEDWVADDAIADDTIDDDAIADDAKEAESASSADGTPDALAAPVVSGRVLRVTSADGRPWLVDPLPRWEASTAIAATTTAAVETPATANILGDVRRVVCPRVRA
jgi:hypothetical protein